MTEGVPSNRCCVGPSAPLKGVHTPRPAQGPRDPLQVLPLDHLGLRGLADARLWHCMALYAQRLTANRAHDAIHDAALCCCTQLNRII